MELKQLPNIGNVLSQQLQDIGVQTPEQLFQLGAKDAWLRIKAIDPSACYNRLCGLEGAIRGIRWHSLPIEVKEDLQLFYQQHRQ